jgi:pSer/pThr/pTyr-binding forkhead associated (FHA) protein
VKLYYSFDGIEQFLEINKGQSTIGRSSSATFTIRHDTISKIHTLLNYDNHVLSIEDMGSSNGTFINGVKITKSEVKPTDHLKVGKVAFRIEMTEEEIKNYNEVKKGSTDDDATPAEGVEVVASEEGQKSETFFDLAEIKSQVPPPAVSAESGNKAVPTTVQLILGNRKNLLLVVGSATVLLLMVVVISSLNKPLTPNGTKTTTAKEDPFSKQIKYEKLMKEGADIFLNSPDKAKLKFQEALILFKDNNATSSMIELCDIWQKSEMNWAKVQRSELRKAIDDIGRESEGQPEAILYKFIKDMSKLEKFEQENENKYAEIIVLVGKYKIDEAMTRLEDISKSSVFYEIANKKIAQSKFNLIEETKKRIRNARDSLNPQEEVRNINFLVTMIPAAEQKEYLVRKEKLLGSLNKENIWKQANEKLKSNDFDDARQLYEMIEQTDEHYYEAVDKLAFIK